MKRVAKKPKVTALDHVYNGLQGSARMLWFDRVRREHNVFPVLATVFGGDAHASKGAPITVNFGINGGTGKLSSRDLAPFRTVMESGRRYGWIPLRLLKPNYSAHANAVWIDTVSKEIVLFEPHGSDASHHGHPPAFKNMYDSATYFESFRMSCAEFDGYTVITPDLYEPPIFGQSMSNVEKTADSWCVLWTLLFFQRMTFVEKGDPGAFVDFIKDKAEKGTITEYVMGLLSDTSWMTV